MPSRTLFPRIATTVSRILSPMTSSSPGLRLSTNMGHTPFHRGFNPSVLPTLNWPARQSIERVNELGEGERLSKDPNGPQQQEIFFRVGQRVPGHEAALDVGTHLLEAASVCGPSIPGMITSSRTTAIAS